MEERYKYFIFEYATELHVPSMPKGFTFSPLENVKKITIDFGDYVTNFKYYASIFPKAKIHIEDCWITDPYIMSEIENLDRFYIYNVSALSRGKYENVIEFADLYTKQGEK